MSKGLFLILLLVPSGVKGCQEAFVSATEESVPLGQRADSASLVDETLRVIREEWVEGLSQEMLRELYEGAAAGMVAALGDRYSRFIPPATSKIEWENTEGEFGGIGVTVSPANGSLQIVGVVEGGPADLAEIRLGDLMISADGVSFEDLEYEEAVSRVRGKVGTPVQVEIWREGNSESLEMRIVRDIVTIPAIGEVKMVSETVGLIEIDEFVRTTPDRVKEALLELQGEGATTLILDLRGNPGGEMGAAIRISDLFIKEGPIVRLKFRNHEESFDAHPGDVGEEMSIYLLQDAFSASASEILAGALQDHGRAVILGDTSFGKGLVQHGEEVPSGGAVIVTTAVYLTPHGNEVHGVGITPDLPFAPLEMDGITVLVEELEALNARIAEIRLEISDRIDTLGVDIVLEAISTPVSEF